MLTPSDNVTANALSEIYAQGDFSWHIFLSTISHCNKLSHMI